MGYLTMRQGAGGIIASHQVEIDGLATFGLHHRLLQSADGVIELVLGNSQRRH